MQTRPAHRPHLWLTTFVARPLFERPQLDALQQLIETHLPGWAAGLAVSKGETRDAVTVGAGASLFDVVCQEAPVRFGLTSFDLTGAYEGVSFFVSASGSTLPPELNEFSVEIVDRVEVEGQPPAQWLRRFFEKAPQALPVRHGNVNSSEEFDAKNMLIGPDGQRAIGVNLDQSLPGLYWLNFLGAPYLDLVGRERLVSTPAHYVQTLSDGVLIALSEEPTEWTTQAYRERERRAIEHIGRELFFSRNAPDRRTIAPRFRRDGRRS